MRIYLIGGSGLLGKEFLAALSGEEGFELFSFDSSLLDITDEAKVCDVFEKNSPNFVINCAAYTAVDDAEQDSEAAFDLNAKAAGNLARCCKKENAILLHFSTDYVFDGEKGSGYFESDEPNPVSVYGQSKLDGEKAVAHELNEHFIVRTSLLFGQHGANFVDLMARLVREKDRLQVIGDKIASPTYAKDLAEFCTEFFVLPFLDYQHHGLDLGDGPAGNNSKPDFGIYHVSNKGACSRFELVREIAKFLDADVELEEVGSEVFNPKARRPANSELLSEKGVELRSWQDALRAYLGN